MSVYRPAALRSIAAPLLSLFLLGLPTSSIADGRLAGTGGVSSINGTGGGGLTGWATLASYADTGQIGGTVHASRADVDDFQLDVLGASATLSNRLELGAARQRFTIKAADSRIEQDRFTAKIRIAGDLLYGNMPQISLSAEHGRLRDPGTALAVGATETEDTDYVLSAARAWIDGVFHRTTLLNVNLRRSRANQYGILGYGGDDPDRQWHAEAAIALFPTRDIAIGAEYRQKPDTQCSGALPWLLLSMVLLAGCTTPGQPDTLFSELGGHDGIDRMVDGFIMEIANDPRVLPRFEDSNVERFREKITEHFCMIADGPCEYTGDSMVLVHAGMDITSPEFNAVVENLMTAMEQADIPLAAQNRLLARLARLRPEIIRI